MSAVTYSELPDKLVSAANGIDYAYREAGEGTVPKTSPEGYLDVFYTRSAESRQAGQQALRRMFARTENRDQPTTWETRQAQYDAVCTWGIPNHAPARRRPQRGRRMRTATTRRSGTVTSSTSSTRGTSPGRTQPTTTRSSSWPGGAEATRSPAPPRLADRDQQEGGGRTAMTQRADGSDSPGGTGSSQDSPAESSGGSSQQAQAAATRSWTGRSWKCCAGTAVSTTWPPETCCLPTGT